MEIKFTAEAWNEYLNWQSNKRILKKINDLLHNISRDSFSGIGKPEHLKGYLSTYCSRPIDNKNRIVYQVENDIIKVFQCGSHYQDK